MLRGTNDTAGDIAIRKKMSSCVVIPSNLLSQSSPMFALLREVLTVIQMSLHTIIHPDSNFRNAAMCVVH